ncbi:MAG: ATP-binding cassette domain-containing protein [Deltaproteobacteria bacterium]|nr:ATP-binding cassette domain-containing protein [Deltaproteobacteria bacterium]
MDLGADKIDPDEAYFLEVRNITKMFGQFTALKDISVGIRQGEFVSVLGPSGCGKTTLLRVIAGLEEQNSGSVWIDSRDVSREPVANRKLGIVFQSYALFPNINIIGNVMYGISRKQFSSTQRTQRAMEMLELVGIEEQAFKYPAQLSGGQQQRVALARALAPSPAILLLDEPLSALDARVRVYLRTEIRRIQETLGVTTLMVTHDQEEALTMADRVVVIEDGSLMQYATPNELYKNPQNTFVAGFIGEMNFISDCTGKDPDSIFFGQYVLQTAEGRAVNYQGRRVIVAIRPEDIRVIRDDSIDVNIINTKVERIEFRGSLYTLYLRVLHQAGGSMDQRLTMDLQVETMEYLQAHTQMELPIHLPPERLLLFKTKRAG